MRAHVSVDENYVGPREFGLNFLTGKKTCIGDEIEDEQPGQKK